jgi:hypothetical protein
MPLDNFFDDSFKRLCIGWELSFCLWPKRCYYSKKLLWLELTYKGTAMITGPGEPLFYYRWVDRNEYLLQKIKGNV